MTHRAIGDTREGEGAGRVKRNSRREGARGRRRGMEVFKRMGRRQWSMRSVVLYLFSQHDIL